MDRVSPEKSTGSLPLVIAMTSLVILVPCVAALGLRASGIVSSPVLLILIPVVVSVLLSQGIALFWKRRRTGSPLLYEDLMLWGWARRRRFERLLARSEDFVGPGAGQGMTPQERAKELERLAGALEARDPHTHGHSRRVAHHSTAIARSLNLAEEEVARIRTAALLHDVGKIGTPREILEKPDRLTEDEFDQVREHSAAGAELVAGMGDAELTAIVRHHHERIDGGGYPDGLVRGQIPLGARIIAVADTFDALTSARAYRQPLSHEQALAILRDEAGTQLDSRAVRAFEARYSSRRPVALAAMIAGLGRQAGQSLIGAGTSATQVAAVGAAAVVIGTAPAADFQSRDGNSAKDSIERQAGAPAEALASTPGTVSVTTADTRSGKPAKVRRVSPSGRGGEERPGGGGAVNGPGEGTDPGDTDGTGGSGGSGSTDGSVGDGGSPGTGGGSGSAPRPSLGQTTEALTETVRKPVQQVTQTVTDAIPTLPGKDPVSQSVNNTVGGIKDTLGKVTGKP